MRRPAQSGGSNEAERRQLEWDLWSLPHLIALASPTVGEPAARVRHRNRMLGSAHARQHANAAGYSRELAKARADVVREAASARAELFRLLVECERIGVPMPNALVEFARRASLGVPASRPRGRPPKSEARGMTIAGEVFARMLAGDTYENACADVADARTEAGNKISEDQVRRLYRQHGLEARLMSPEGIAWMNSTTKTGEED